MPAFFQVNLPIVFLKYSAFTRKLAYLNRLNLGNYAAHDYDIDYAEIADHFNMLKTLTPLLYMTAARFHKYCKEELYIEANQADFTTEFMQIISAKQNISE